MNTELPISSLLPQLVATLREHRAVVLEAPPGAGKTTQVPSALLDAGLVAAGHELWVAEPRRVAARLAATRVAEERGQALGEEVGYSVRFEERASERTRIRFVTEGILLQRLRQGAPPPVVILDEFHERHLATDLCLMLLRRQLREGGDLRLVVMSATLDGEAVASYLGDCPRLRSEGRSFPLQIEHVPVDDRRLEQQVTSAVRSLLRQEPEGNLLAFLPGVAEIHRTRDAVTQVAKEHDVDVFPLYGELPLSQQAAAISATGKRKLVLATNVAESSVTVANVRAVIDTGLARQMQHSPWTGRPVLALAEISQASAIQRAGRAGRTAPGRVIRSYSEASFRARPARDTPEMQRLDVAEPLLILLGAGVGVEEGEFLSPPPEPALQAARELLERLGFLHDTGLTERGHAALGLSVPPRLAQLILTGAQLGIPARACLAAALLSDRAIDTAQDLPLLGADCDVDRMLQLYWQATEKRSERRGNPRASGALRPAAVQSVRRSARQLQQELARARSGETKRNTSSSDALSGEAAEKALSKALLHAFPDRVARRSNDGRRVLLSTGHSATLSESSSCQGFEFLVAVGVHERKSSTGPGRRLPEIGIATPLDPEWLLDMPHEEPRFVEELRWDAERQRVMASSQMRWGTVIIEESEQGAAPGEAAGALLLRAAQAQRARLFDKHSKLPALLGRLQLLARQFPEAGLEGIAPGGESELLAFACRQVTSLDELRRMSFEQMLLSQLDGEQQRLLHSQAPEAVTLPSGRRATIHYEVDKEPFLASRLQDFFGWEAGPSICQGRVPLTLHLLAPNQRAVQVTQDLAGFWQRHYPELRRQLSRRYPKHPWPEDHRKPVPAPARRPRPERP